MCLVRFFCATLYACTELNIPRQLYDNHSSFKCLSKELYLFFNDRMKENLIFSMSRKLNYSTMCINSIQFIQITIKLAATIKITTYVTQGTMMGSYNPAM